MSKEVYDRIALLDGAMFDAYNACDIDKVGTFFAEDLEFYHEKGGLTTETMASACDGSNKNDIVP